ncbi:MAG: NAD(P)-binding domain-containing protein [Clostridiales bacterium]|jgi:dipicolinate synthase subunit A|nr:NAD(P)-binding domain-containing protein [Clostridiales bacterium]
MDIFVAGGDRRSAFLVRLLRERGLDARAAGLERSGLAQVPSAPLKAAADAETVVLNSPLKCDLAETPFGIGDLLGHLHSGARLVFCGPQIPPAGLERFDARDLTKDEDFLQRNAELTAEGAIYSAMRATERAIMDCDCLIVGWGRIGRALTERLVALGARATVASRTDRGMRLAQSRGAQAVETAKIADALPGRHIVFSTPPYPVLGKDELSRADAGTLFIDLASPPYGIDLEAARSLDLRAWREPGLPGRYCPESAAMVLMSHILALRKGGISRD